MITAVGTLGKCYIVKEEDKFYYKDASVICLENRFELNADYLVNYIIEQSIKPLLGNSKNLKVLDPSCGSRNIFSTNF